MLTNQEMKIDGNDITLKNTFDVGGAKSLVADLNKSGGAQNSNIKLMGYIPPEMFCYNPWLIQANKAAIAGDKAEHDKMIQKFFELYPCFRVANGRRVWQGGISS